MAAIVANNPTLRSQFIESVMNIICPSGKEEVSKEVLLYGYNHCIYSYIKYILNHKEVQKICKIQKAMDWTDQCGDPTRSTLLADGLPLSKIQTKQKDIENQGMARKFKQNTECKAGLVNIVFENYKRKKLGKPLIPILFCIDVYENEFALKTENFTSKEESFNKLLTNKEIRRAFKLCTLPGELGQVAEETFVFIKVMNTNFILEPLPAPWHHLAWRRCWTERTKGVTSSDSCWKKELAILKAEFDKSQDLPDSSASSKSSMSYSSLSSSYFSSSTEASS